MTELDEGARTARSSSRSGNLRQLALSGGLYLTIRELVGMVVRLAGVAIVTRLLGPALYGDYFGSSTFIAVVGTAAQMGAELWLLRQPDEPTDRTMQEVWTSLVVVSCVVTAIALLLTLPAGLFVPAARLDPFRLLVLSVPINVLWAPAQARIERNFAYRQMAWLELGGDLVLYGVSVPLALVGFGVYSLIIGYLAWQTFLLLGSLRMARFRPRIRWNPVVMRSLMRNGLGVSSNDWAQRLGALSATVVIGSISGASGVGLLGLALRLVDTVGFGLRATWRLGMATLSRLSDDLPRLRRALEQGMVAQAVVLGVPMLSLALISHWAIPLVFGRVWLPSAELYCIVCIGRLVTSPAQLQTTLLYMHGRITDVTRGAALGAALLWIVSIPLSLAFGTVGYCEAVVLSSAGWIVVDRATRRVITFSYRNTALCLLAFVPGLLVPVIHSPLRWCLLLPVLVPVADGGLRRELAGFAEVVVSGIRSRFHPTARPEGEIMTTARVAPATDGVLFAATKRRRLAVLRRRGSAAVLVMLLAVAASVAYARQHTPTYLADAYAVVNSGATVGGPGNAQQAETLAQTYATEIAQDNGIVTSVATILDVPTGEVAKSISVTQDYQTADLVLSYTASTPPEAVRGATALGGAVSRGTADGAVPQGSITVASYPTTAALTSSRSHDALPLGVLGGLLAGFAVALAWERLDPRIDDEDDLRDLLGLPSTRLPGLSRQAAAALAGRWFQNRRSPGGSVVLLSSVPDADDAAAEISTAFSELLKPALPVAALRWAEIPSLLSTEPGTTVLVVRPRARAKVVLRTARELDRIGQRPDWVVLSSR